MNAQSTTDLLAMTDLAIAELETIDLATADLLAMTDLAVTQLETSEFATIELTASDLATDDLAADEPLRSEQQPTQATRAGILRRRHRPIRIRSRRSSSNLPCTTRTLSRSASRNRSRRR